MKKIIAFIHIERAGGTSLHHLLHYNFKKYITINPRGLYTNLEKAIFTPDNLKKLQLRYPGLDGFGGHTIRSFMNYEAVLNYPIFFLTFLRDPVKRYISHFNYQKNVMNINWELEEFIKTDYFKNFQCKKIIGTEDPEQAFQELKRYSFVGVTEYYNESLLMLKSKIDWFDFKPLYEKKNKIPSNKKNIKFEHLPTKIQSKIIDNNKLDQELYDTAVKNIFNKQRKDLSGKILSDLDKLEKELDTFKYPFIRRLISIYNKLYFRYFVEPKLYS